MRSNDYYNKRGTSITVTVSILAYVASILMVSSKMYKVHSEGAKIGAPNYDIGYKKVIALDSKMDNKNKSKTKGSMDSIEYDIGTMYLDWSDIEAQRAVLEAEELAREKERERIASMYNVPTVVKQEESKLLAVDGSMGLPALADTSFKGYMCMHKVTNRTSKQWEFLHSGDFEFNTEVNGIMMYKDYYVVAMATHYNNYQTGATFKITLDTGKFINVINGDIKADKDTDVNNTYRPKGSNRGEIVEFVVACGMKGEVCNEYHTMTEENRKKGNLSSLGFEGNVVKIERIDDTSVTDILYK